MVSYCLSPISRTRFSACLVPQASKAELMVMTVSEIVKRLIEAHEEGKDVNLNKWVGFDPGWMCG